MRRTAIAAGAVALLTGCGVLTHTGTYDSKAFAPWRIARDKKIEGRALILTAAADDAFVYSGRPRGFVGSATTLRLPLGVVTREAAVRVFGDLFVGGADESNDASRLDGYRAVVAPRLAGFGYDYGWFTPRFEVSVRVALLDTQGRVAFEKTYDSGRLEASTHGDRDTNAKAIDRATYVTVQRLMLRAAADVKAHLEGRPPLPAEPPHGATPLHASEVASR